MGGACGVVATLLVAAGVSRVRARRSKELWQKGLHWGDLHSRGYEDLGDDVRGVEMTTGGLSSGDNRSGHGQQQEHFSQAAEEGRGGLLSQDRFGLKSSGEKDDAGDL